MTDSPMILAARELLVLAWEGPAPEAGVLCAALDRLLAESHAIPDGKAGYEWPAAACQDHRALRAQARRRFPDFDLYTFEDPDHGISVGDPLDDLCDLTGDLRVGLWLAEHVGPKAAHHQLRDFHWHWTWHGRHLAAYLRERAKPDGDPWAVLRIP